MHAAHALALDRTPAPPEVAPRQAAPVCEQTAWALLDDPDEWPAFGQLCSDRSGEWESALQVEGMHCAACALSVEAVLQSVPGVVAAQVSSASGRASVRWSAAQTQPSRWFAAVHGAGYRLLPAGESARRSDSRRASRMALWRWLVAGLCMMQVMMYALPAYLAQPGEITPDMTQLLRWAGWVLTLPVVLFSCSPFFQGAWRELRSLRPGMDTPVALGMLIVFAVSSAATFDPTGLLGREVYFDSLTMFVFFLLTGRWLEARLRERTVGALDALLQRLPASALRRGVDGTWERVALHRLAVGDVLRVLPGEAFAADGILLVGETSADEALLTGESTPIARGVGDSVHAGSHNLAAPVELRVQATGADTRFGQIVALMHSAALQKPRLAQLADRVARPFLLLVLLAALAAGAWHWHEGPGQALMVAVAVLIVTCPCALSLATPAAMLASAGALARRGVLVANLQALEALADVDTVVFDKTGTLTRALPRLERVVHSRNGTSAAQALAWAAALAQNSLHPVSRALVRGWQANEGPDAELPWQIRDARESPGQGLQGQLVAAGEEPGVQCPGRAMRLGKADFCGIEVPHALSMQVHLADEAGWLASFNLSEDLREDAGSAIAALHRAGVTTQLLSGDRAASAQQLARRAGIDRVQGDCRPEDKLAAVRALQGAGYRVAMVGDGLNDTPVLAQANVSFAFGAAVELARARADFVVLGEAVGVIPQAVAQARRTVRVVRQNLGWAAAYNALCVPLAVAGWLPAWLAGLGMAGSSLVVVLNAARLAKASS